MSDCDRFEREGLEMLEQGLPLDEHFDTCADCVEARRVYESLMQQVAASGSALEPPPQWRAKVWEAIEAEQSPEREGFFDRMRDFGRAFERAPMRFTIPAAAAAILALVSILWLAQPGGEVSLRSTIVAQGTAVRGGDAHPGDLLQLRAGIDDSRYTELRVYFNGRELAMSCSSELPCRRDGDVIEADVELESLGAYQALLFLSDEPLPPSTGDLDQDAGAALDAGARVELGERIPVR